MWHIVKKKKVLFLTFLFYVENGVCVHIESQWEMLSPLWSKRLEATRTQPAANILHRSQNSPVPGARSSRGRGREQQRNLGDTNNEGDTDAVFQGARIGPTGDSMTTREKHFFLHSIIKRRGRPLTRTLKVYTWWCLRFFRKHILVLINQGMNSFL